MKKPTRKLAFLFGLITGLLVWPLIGLFFALLPGIRIAGERDEIVAKMVRLRAASEEYYSVYKSWPTGLEQLTKNARNIRFIDQSVLDELNGELIRFETGSDVGIRHAAHDGEFETADDIWSPGPDDDQKSND